VLTYLQRSLQLFWLRLRPYARRPPVLCGMGQPPDVFRMSASTGSVPKATDPVFHLDSSFSWHSVLFLHG
jgi:hypothetical protein